MFVRGDWKTRVNCAAIVLLVCLSPALVGAIEIPTPIGVTGAEERLQPFGSPGAAAYEPKSAYDESLSVSSRLSDLEYAYARSVVNALDQSDAPRDLALTALLASASTDRSHINQLVQRAADAAPNDLLVQWLALAVSLKYAGSEKRAAAAMQALQQLDPDNGVIWLTALERAKRNHDDVAVESMLKRAVASTRWIEYDNEVFKALFNAYQHYPLSAKHEQLLARQKPPQSGQSEVYALAEGATEIGSTERVLQNYQALDGLCTVEATPGKNVAHAETCARIGRLMFDRGNTFTANHTGAWLLATSATFSDDDVQRARDQDWIVEQYRALTIWPKPQQTSAEAIAYGSERSETGDELEAMRHALLRAGKSLKPPEKWKDGRSPFSPGSFENRSKLPRLEI